jgi:hypothetical protein
MCDDGQITNSERKGKSMTNKNKATKQLSKALAVLLTLGSLLGVTGAPAFAEYYDKDLNVEVTAVPEDPEDPPCYFDPTPALWTLGEVSYPGGSDDVDLNFGNDLDFTINSTFTTGLTNGECPDSALVDPTGVVTLEVNDFDNTQIVVSWLDCGPDVDECLAVDHVVGANLNGTLEVQDGTPVGVYYGKLRATWTPAS